MLVVGFAVATLLTAICRLVADGLGYGALVRLAVGRWPSFMVGDADHDFKWVISVSDACYTETVP